MIQQVAELNLFCQRVMSKPKPAPPPKAEKAKEPAPASDAPATSADGVVFVHACMCVCVCVRVRVCVCVWRDVCCEHVTVLLSVFFGEFMCACCCVLPVVSRVGLAFALILIQRRCSVG